MKRAHKYIILSIIVMTAILFSIHFFLHQIITAFTHVLGLCVTFIQFTIPFLPIIFTSLLFYSLLRVTVNLIKTYIYQKTLSSVVNAPAVVKKLGKKHTIFDRIIVFEHDLPKAFCLGLFHPKIYISTALINLMNIDELEAILLHEKHHLIRNDNISQLIFSLTKHFFILFPIISDLITKYTEQMEIEADKWAIKELHNESLLLSSFKKLLINPSQGDAAFAYVSSYTQHSTLESRIKAIMGKQYTYNILNIKNICISTFSFLILAGFILYPVKITHAHHDVNLPEMCLKNNSCPDQRCG